MSVVPTTLAQFELKDPQNLLREYRATPEKRRAFCARCGAPIFSARDGLDAVRVRAGLFENLPNAQFAGHIFAAERAAWGSHSDTLPYYVGLEPGRATPTTKHTSEPT